MLHSPQHWCRSRWLATARPTPQLLAPLSRIGTAWHWRMRLGKPPLDHTSHHCTGPVNHRRSDLAKSHWCHSRWLATARQWRRRWRAGVAMRDSLGGSLAGCARGPEGSTTSACVTSYRMLLIVPGAPRRLRRRASVRFFVCACVPGHVRHPAMRVVELSPRSGGTHGRYAAAHGLCVIAGFQLLYALRDGVHRHDLRGSQPC